MCVCYVMEILIRRSKLVRGIRKSTQLPAGVNEFCIYIFAGSTHSYMQWVKVVWPRMSLLCARCLLFIVIHILISACINKLNTACSYINSKI